MKYLIIDDSIRMRKLIRQAICMKEDSFIECPDVDEAINLYNRHMPDFVLIEIQTQKMQGLNALKKIRAKFPNSKIIVITDYDTSASRLAAIDAGALVFISKENLSEVKEFINKMSSINIVNNN